MDKIKSLMFNDNTIRIEAIIIIILLFVLAFIVIKKVKFFDKPFFKFVLVGVFNTINYYIAYVMILKIAPYLLAHILAFIYSALVSYFLTTYYTFNKKPSLKTFIAFPLTFLPNLLLSSFGTMLFVEMKVFTKDVASLVMMILIIPITFIISKFIFVKKNDN